MVEKELVISELTLDKCRVEFICFFVFGF